MRFLLLSLLLLPFSLASVSTIYFPISNPDANNPWIVGQKNLLAWKTGGGSGVESFDIQLHNWNKTIMTGFLPIALRVPMERLPTGRHNYGGEIEVDLDLDMPTGTGFTLIFIDTLSGKVYARSKVFSILATTPSNFTTPTLPTATVTATITDLPNPLQQYALTLNGIDPDATATTTINYAGVAGNGQARR